MKNINHEEVKHDSQSELVAGPDHSWGILVKLVICVLPGHWKIKIPNLTKYIDFGCFLVGYITYNEKKVLGHLNLPTSPFLVNI